MNPHASAAASPSDAPGHPRGQRLSDLADGRLDDAALTQAVADWAGDAQARRTWHAYQLIGDVLRSDDLASPPAGDAAFLVAVRQRLAAEPVVLAPVPASASASMTRRRLRQAWMRPVVAAAGFVAVAGVVVVLQQAAPDASLAPAAGPQMALQGNPAVTTVAASSPNQVQPASRVVVVPEGRMQRDPRIDACLRAHRESFAGSPAALPGGAMRNVDADVTAR